MKTYFSVSGVWYRVYAADHPLQCPGAYCVEFFTPWDHLAIPCTAAVVNDFGDLVRVPAVGRA